MWNRFGPLSLAILVCGCAMAPSDVAGTPVPSQAASSSASAEAPSLSATPTATPTPDMLQPGAEARVVVDSLHLRSEPGTDAPVVATMPRGAVVYLFGPPFARSVDGVTWRLMRYAAGYADWPAMPGDGEQLGWAATEDAENAFIRSEPIDCPPGPPDAETLVAMTEWAHVACFGDDVLVVEGTVITGFGGYAPGEWEPSWLASPFGFSGAIQTDGGQLFYHREGGGQAGYVDGQRLRITGHYDHSAASTCRIASGEPPVPEPDALAVAYCRARFVATAIEELAE